MTTAELAEYLRDSHLGLEKTIILVNSPRIIEKLIQLGAPIDKVNVGGIHFKDGRKKLLNYLYVNEDEIASFKRCIDKGVEFDCQDVPLCKRTPLRKLIQ